MKSVKTKSFALQPTKIGAVYCDNEHCETLAVDSVPVSVKRVGDAARNLCGPCLVAYHIGVQHGRIRTLAERRMKRRRHTKR